MIPSPDFQKKVAWIIPNPDVHTKGAQIIPNPESPQLKNGTYMEPNI
jgi:hypothetical protein